MKDIQINFPNSPENLKLPDPELKEYYQQIQDRVLWLDFEINENILALSKLILRYNKEDEGNNIPVEKRKPIKILIYSLGGDAHLTIHFIKLIEISKTPIYTYNMGIAFSGAFYILIAGHKKFALKDSFALYHSGSGGTAGTYEQTLAQMNEYKMIQKVLETHFLAKTKVDKAIFNKQKKTEWYMDSSQQLKNGVADAIIENINDLV